jgi:hypothetical protein
VQGGIYGWGGQGDELGWADGFYLHPITIQYSVHVIIYLLSLSFTVTDSSTSTFTLSFLFPPIIGI